MTAPSPPRFDRDQVVRLWLHRQGLAAPRGEQKLTRRTFVDHLERTGALQLDPINVVDRAHYLTLWSRFGPYDRRRVDRWAYRDRAAYEYWGHEASLLPISHLAIGRRRMRGFPGSWKEKSWWPRFDTPPSSKRRVLKRLREEGPLESTDFERRPEEDGDGVSWGSMPLPKEDRRSLKVLWHGGRVAVRERRQFRCVFDLAERVYPDGLSASVQEFEDSWLLAGLLGNGIASEQHLVNYFTAPDLKAPARKRVIERALKRGRIAEVRVDGVRGRCYALPEHLDGLGGLTEPRGTTLICPFDSLLWQRKRAEELFGFQYRLEIYVPAAKRRHGYYVMPILHDGSLVGRLDPVLHRERGMLEVASLRLERSFDGGREFTRGLRAAIESLATFAGAEECAVPRAWRRALV